MRYVTLGQGRMALLAELKGHGVFALQARLYLRRDFRRSASEVRIEPGNTAFTPLNFVS